MLKPSVLRFLAEKGMGWRLITETCGCVMAAGTGPTIDPCHSSVAKVWDPSARWDDCGQLIEAFRRSLEKQPEEQSFALVVTPGLEYHAYVQSDTKIYSIGNASSGPLAITEAIYRALGGEEAEIEVKP